MMGQMFSTLNRREKGETEGMKGEREEGGEKKGEETGLAFSPHSRAGQHQIDRNNKRQEATGTSSLMQRSYTRIMTYCVRNV